MTNHVDSWFQFLAGAPLLSRAERRKAGRGQRERVALAEHSYVPSPKDRADPNQILVGQDKHRTAELVPLRHGRMNADPFSFYRGGAAIMAADLATMPTPHISAQLCGDAHLANFGLYYGPDRRLVFDVNDFDETHPGPFEWDVKRLAASVWIAGEANDLSESKTERAVRSAVAGYRSMIDELSTVAARSLPTLRS